MRDARASLPPAAAVPRAVGHAPRRRVAAQRILRISRVVADLDRAEAFYRDALGFRVVARGPGDQPTIAALGLGESGGQEVVMRLGEQDIALVRFAVPGRPYPPHSRSDDLWFQHLAIVVNDIDAAFAHLGLHRQWSAITEGAPQLLPPSNGAVRAFKFRDPDGHPLELLWFPPAQGRAVWHQDAAGGPFLGIDHSALCVASTRRSVAFYRGLGFGVCGRSLNHGPAQSRLDGLADARVRVTTLRPLAAAGLGLELLDYRPSGRPMGSVFANDTLTDWVTLAVTSLPGMSPGMSPCALCDPDGHRLVLVDQGAGATGLPA